MWRGLVLCSFAPISWKISQLTDLLYFTFLELTIGLSFDSFVLFYALWDTDPWWKSDVALTCSPWNPSLLILRALVRKWCVCSCLKGHFTDGLGKDKGPWPKKTFLICVNEPNRALPSSVCLGDQREVPLAGISKPAPTPRNGTTTLRFLEPCSDCSDDRSCQTWPDLAK